MFLCRARAPTWPPRRRPTGPSRQRHHSATVRVAQLCLGFSRDWRLSVRLRPGLPTIQGRLSCLRGTHKSHNVGIRIQFLALRLVPFMRLQGDVWPTATSSSLGCGRHPICAAVAKHADWWAGCKQLDARNRWIRSRLRAIVTVRSTENLIVHFRQILGI